MRRYETIFIGHADLPEEEINSLIETYSAIIMTGKGLIVKSEKWGKRKLAYEINKQSRGYYVLFDFAADPDVVTELERNMKINDKILKYMTVKTRDAVKREEIEKEIAEAEAKKAPAVAEVEPTSPQGAAEESALEKVETESPQGAAEEAAPEKVETESPQGAAEAEVPATTGEVQSALSSPEPELKEEA